MNSKELKMIKESIDSYIESIPTEDLIRELNKRKATELPKLIKGVNERLNQIRALAGEIHNESEPFTLYELQLVECGSEKGSVIYTEHEVDV